MKEFLLERDDHSVTETMGILRFDGIELQTIERPWIPTAPGGEPRKSCIPSGRYILRSHKRRNGDQVLSLTNPGHGVYYLDEDRTNQVGRFLILIHSANWSDQVIGCIAPGKSRTVSDRGRMVTNSRESMKKIMDYFDGEEATINITWKNGEPA